MNTKLKILTALIIICAQYSLSFAQNYGSWREIDSLNIARVYAARVLLPDGNVIVSGGSIDSIQTSSEIYDFKTGAWRYTAPMNTSRTSHNLVLLKTGKVLAIGGLAERSCELFDPVTETWTMTDSIPTLRHWGQTVTTLNDGRIMVAGGTYMGDSVALNAVNIFNPVTGKWTAGTPMHAGREQHTATKLNDGRVLVTGGLRPNIQSPQSQCEIFDPVNNIWEITTPLLEKRNGHAAILLNNGNVFVSGNGAIGLWSNTCEVYDVSTKIWTYVPSMLRYRADHSIYYLSAVDKLLIIGGTFTGADHSWEIYDPNSMQPIYLGYFPGFYNKNQILFDNNLQLLNGNIIVVGGWTIDMSSGMPYINPTKFAWMFDIVTNIEQENENIEGFSLGQNYPNPFNPSTVISWQLPVSGHVSLKIFDLLGREVATIVDEFRQAGTYVETLHATSLLSKGSLTSGVYIYSLRVNGYVQHRKMTLLK